MKRILRSNTLFALVGLLIHISGAGVAVAENQPGQIQLEQSAVPVTTPSQIAKQEPIQTAPSTSVLDSLESQASANVDDNTTSPIYTNNSTGSNTLTIDVDNPQTLLGQVGGFDITSNLRVSQVYTDNLLQDKDSEIHTFVTNIAPSLQFNKLDGLNRYNMNYQFDHRNFSARGRDNITNQRLSASGLFDFDIRHRLNANINYAWLHEMRGRDFSNGFGDQLTEPTSYNVLNVSTAYIYGSKTAAANLIFDYRISDINYDSVYLDELNLDDPIPDTDERFDITADREHQTHTLASTFKYRLGAFTDMSLRLTYKDTDYDTKRYNQASLNNREYEISGRFAWQGSAITTGYVDVGYATRSYSDDARSSKQGIRWKAGVLWQPLTYSNVDVSTARQIYEPKGQGSYIENANISLAWHHNWLSRLGSRVAVSFNEDDYGDSTRKDDNRLLNASAQYQMRDNLKFDVSFTHHQRSSNVADMRFTENRLSFNVNYQL
ncbi:outer membrane beta-barrel protein [Thalassotalea ponticola]|uniref:outer membrane beta-barrel protein n=1 Tax=Thalassotalea ponticola TaxID=1523392 RepID=UPI0025B5DCC6|nr:outer membrane beta-barrel protein [Thalassotalea ponticola]MDN3652632.1 outer membrane beta-barrel protein [Thalassotalea ponticola]